MCRHVAYLGPPITLKEIVLDPPGGLLEQSYAPKDMRGGGTINADGFGVGWWAGDRFVRYRRPSPLWSDSGFADLAAVTTSGAILAAVRSATVGMPVTEAACAPYAGDGWLFSHNGVVPGWPDSVAKLAAQLPVTDLMTLDAPTDSALLWALLRRQLNAGVDPASALRGLVADVSASAPGARLNLMLTNGHTIYATTFGHALSVALSATRGVVASEPWSGIEWEAVPEKKLVIADRTTRTMEELCG